MVIRIDEKQSLNQPVKFIIDYPCPIDSNIRCKHSKMEIDNTIMTFQCVYQCDKKIILKNGGNK